MMIQANTIITVPPEQLACYPSLEQLVNWMIRDEDVHLIPAPERITEICLITVAKGWKPYIYPMLPNLRSIQFLFRGGEFSLPAKKDGDYLRNFPNRNGCLPYQPGLPWAPTRSTPWLRQNTRPFILLTVLDSVYGWRNQSPTDTQP
jgi:hypothetical protein